MDDQSLRNVLAILRLVQVEGTEKGGVSVSAYQFIRFLATGISSRDLTQRSRAENTVNAVSIARIAAYLLDQISQAREVIDASQLVEEAKAGVRSALDALARAFEINSLGGSLSGLAISSPGYISNLVILLSAAGISVNQSAPPEATDLAKEVDALAEQFNDTSLDPVIRELARKHLATLATLIRHIPIFGLEASLQAYFELIMKLRRADSKSTPESKSNLDKLMEPIKSWGERLQTLDGIINTGANLLDRASKAAPILQYIPSI